jgi:hypothetical protein
MKEDDAVQPKDPLHYNLAAGVALPESARGYFSRAEASVLAAIRDNSRGAGEHRLCRLPVTALAEYAHVSTSTARKALKQALEEGLVRQTDDGLVNLAIKEWIGQGRSRW